MLIVSPTYAVSLHQRKLCFWAHRWTLFSGSNGGVLFLVGGCQERQRRVNDCRVENGRERSEKSPNHSCFCIFQSGTGAGTGNADGKTKPILWDIGNGIYRSGTCRLRSGIGNSRRENTCNHFKHEAQENSYRYAQVILDITKHHTGM